MNIGRKLSGMACVMALLVSCTWTTALSDFAQLTPQPTIGKPTPEATASTLEATPTSGNTFVATATPIGLPAPMSTPASPSAPPACQPPPDDYTRVTIGDHQLNARTLWMLRLAGSSYHGRGDPLNITQGSYTDDDPASFGTHAGGGAVDISVRVKDKPAEILSKDEIAELVTALRQAGFAAWARFPEDFDPPAPLHIHAIAIGDRELSEAARRQLDGPGGYFQGFDGVPPEHGGPKPDRYGGPIICGWMAELGFTDLR
jgi:hypothetical protein